MVSSGGTAGIAGIPGQGEEAMMNKILETLLGRRSSKFQDYYQGTITGVEGSPKIDEARKDFHRMMRAQNPFSNV